MGFVSLGFRELTQLSIPDGTGFFVAGVNTLDFVINNGGTAANPSGLRVDDLALSGVTITQPPGLAVSLSGGIIQIAWPTNATGFALQETSALPGGWTNSAASVSFQGNQSVATINPVGSAKFYRLVK